MQTPQKLIIYGNGQMAKMLHQFFQEQYDVVAFTVDEQFITSKQLNGLPIIDFNLIDQHYSSTEHAMIIVVGYVQMNGLRKQKCEEAKDKGYHLVNYIHPTVQRHQSVMFGENIIILDYVSIHPYTKVGNGVFISSNTNIGHGCIIGDNCWINSGVAVAGETVIGEQCFLGVNAALGHALTIGKKCFIGANALINTNTDANGVYISESAVKFRMHSDDFLKFSSTL